MDVNEKRNTPLSRQKIQLEKLRKAKQLSNNIEREKSSFTSSQIEEFFQATEDGSIERLEQLFNERKDADPNMTHFTESLLMAAIRRERPEVAEYLIDQLAVNVKYAADLHEFHVRTKNPIRHRTFSCRDLAYEKGMMELVDLIDITDDQVKPSIKRYLRKRVQARLDNIRQSYLKRLTEQSNPQPTVTSTDEKDNNESLTTARSDDRTTQQSIPALPSIQPLRKSHIAETVQNIDLNTDRSIEEKGKKSFHFSNYSLRFRLVETKDKGKKLKEQSKLTTSIPSLPIIQLSSSTSSQLNAKNSSRRSFSEISGRLSMRDTSTSGCGSVRHTHISDMLSNDNKSTITQSSKHILPRRVNKKYIRPSYIPQQNSTFYNQPQRVVPVTLKATAVGLPSDTRIIRD